jgi:hypothetical protein
MSGGSLFKSSIGSIGGLKSKSKDDNPPHGPHFDPLLTLKPLLSYPEGKEISSNKCWVALKTALFMHKSAENGH